MKHDFGSQVMDLHMTCKRCGYKMTIVSNLVASVNGGPPPCPGFIAAVPLPDIDLDRPMAIASHCECGSHKVLGVGRGQPGHSSWCPWSNA
jgi:hypothetical protein